VTIITGKIGSGKTVELVRYAFKNNCTIICQFEESIKCIQDLAQRLYGRDVKAISYSTFFYNSCFHRRNDNTKYVIDSIESFLMRLMTERGSTSSIEGFTCDGEDIIFKERINGEYYSKHLV